MKTISRLLADQVDPNPVGGMRWIDGRTNPPHSAQPTQPSELRSLPLSPALITALQTFSHQADCSLFVTLLVALKILIYRYSGQETLRAVQPATPRDLNRSAAEPAVSTLYYTDLSGNPAVRDLLGRVQSSQGSDLGSNALEGSQRDQATVDLYLTLQDSPDGLVAAVVYDRALFPIELDDLFRHWPTVLEQIITAPDQRLSDLSLLTADERHRVLVEWNQTEQDYPPSLVQDLIAAQAEQTPEAIALMVGPQHLTYRALNARANQLAHYLRTLGVGPGTLVGLYVERSLDMVVGLLGILKAGGAYVPLDPLYPPERLALMVEDSALSIVLTHESLRPSLPSHISQVVCLDQDWLTIALCSTANIPTINQGTDVAYTIYTSGSTGKPKGVQILHHALVNILWAMKQSPGLDATDILVAVTTVCFDIAAIELYLPLIVGARIVLASRETATDPHQLAHLLATSQATVMQATPATWRMLLAMGWSGSSQLKILCGGEALSRDLANQLLSRSQSVWNLYGPTETTIWSTLHRVEAGSGPVPIGRPFANTQLYLLQSADPGDCERGDRDLGDCDLGDCDLGDRLIPVPVGMVGELYIGGKGLAKSYLNRPELTQTRFIPHPFDPDPTARLYRTGDLARYLPDGTVECLGRSDHQVKIRGFRIELGDIEAALNRCDPVKESVVVARTDSQGISSLVAYVVFHPDQMSPVMSPEELRQGLRQTLPEPMVPACVVVLDAFPLTPNGKIDRQALPAPTGSSDLDLYVAPRDELEQQLVQIWQHVLGQQPIGIRHNFFELGGHSLLAVQLFAQIAAEFNIQLPLATLFTAPTIEQLALLFRDPDWTPPQTSLVPLQLTGTKPPLFCVHPIGGHVFEFRLLAPYLGTDRPLYGLQARGLNGEAPPDTQIETMAAHYIQQIRLVQPEGPYYLIGFCSGSVIAYEMAQQLQQQGQSVAMLAFLDYHLVPDHWPFGKMVAQPPRTMTQAQRDVVFATEKALNHYIPHPYRGRVTLLSCVSTLSKLRTQANMVERNNQWILLSELVPNGIYVYPIFGEHSTVFKTENLSQLARTIQNSIDDLSENQKRLDLNHHVDENLNLEMIDVYRQAIASHPHRPFWLYQHLAVALSQQGEYREAIAAYDRARALQPSGIYHTLGNGLSAGQSLHQSILAYQNFLQVDGDRVPPTVAPYSIALQQQAQQLLTELQQTFDQQPEQISAEWMYEKAVQSYPEDDSIRHSLANHYLKTGQVGDAIAHYRRAIYLNGSNLALYYCSLGSALQKVSDWLGAIAAYQSAIAQDPDCFLAYEGLGDSLAQQKQIDQAIAAYQQVIRLRPDYAKPYACLGAIALNSLQDSEMAAQAFRQVMALTPENAWAHRNLAEVLCRQGAHPTAQESYQTAVALQSTDANLHVSLAILALYDFKDPDMALPRVRTALRLQPTHVEAHRVLGDVMTQQGNVNRALAAYQKALNLDPNHVQAHVSLGYLRLRRNQIRPAIAHFKRAIELQPSHAGAIKGLSTARQKRRALLDTGDRPDCEQKPCPS